VRRPAPFGRILEFDREQVEGVHIDKIVSQLEVMRPDGFAQLPFQSRFERIPNSFGLARCESSTQ